MAKGIAINGQLRGKLGGTVYYRAYGDQISRSRNFKPSNPKTYAQMFQRLALANASKLAKGLRGIVDHSFEGKQYGAVSTRYFMSGVQKALKSSNASITSGGVELTALVPFAAVGFPVVKCYVSEGSLSPLAYTAVHNEITGAITGVSADLSVASSVTSLTCREFLAAFGAAPGTQLTFIFIEPREAGVADSLFYNNFVSKIVRVNFLESQLDEVALTTEFQLRDSVLDVDRCTNTDFLRVRFNDSGFSVEDGGLSSAIAVIASRYESGVWRRSSELLQLAAGWGSATGDAVIDDWGWNLASSIDALITGSAEVVEDRFLNKEPNDGFAIL